MKPLYDLARGYQDPRGGEYTHALQLAAGQNSLNRGLAAGQLGLGVTNCQTLGLNAYQLGDKAQNPGRVSGFDGFGRNASCKESSMKDAPHQPSDTPFRFGTPAPKPAPAPAQKVEHVRGSIYSVDGKLETRGYVPGSSK